MLKYEDCLWGKVEFLHNRYHKINSNLSHYLELMTKFQMACQTFSKTLNSISSESYKIYSDKIISLYPVIEAIPKNIILHSKEFADISEFINGKIIEQVTKSLNEIYVRENNLYENYVKSKRTYNNSKIDLEKSKNTFNDNAKICENLIVNAKTMKYNALASKKEIEKNENLASEGLFDAVNYENRYIEFLKETNKNREDANEKERSLLNMYQDIDKEFVIKIKGMVSMYIAGIKKMYSTILTDISWIHNQFKKINSENDTNMFINKYKSNIQKEGKIPFVAYEPKITLNPKSTGDFQKDENILDINLEVISSLKKGLKSVCPNVNLEEEDKKRRLRFLTSRIFKINTDFPEEEKKELIEYIKEASFRKYFILMLSKQRIKGRYKRSKKLIDDLSDILNKILEIDEKEKDYEEAKNCIILSQTYFYEIKKEDKKLYKYYLFNRIKHNKWLNSIEFWENLLVTMVEIEIKNSEKSIKKYNLSEKHKKNALNNIGFSQLLTYSQNMLEFGINKEDVISFVKKFIDKYEVSQEYSSTILDNINNFKRMTLEEEITEEPKEKNSIKRKATLSKEENDNDILGEFFPNSVINKKNKINLLNNDNVDNNINKINIINDNKDEDEKDNNINKIIIINENNSENKKEENKINIPKNKDENKINEIKNDI